MRKDGGRVRRVDGVERRIPRLVAAANGMDDAPADVIAVSSVTARGSPVSIGSSLNKLVMLGRCMANSVKNGVQGVSCVS